MARVYSLYATLSQDPKLIEFSFILGWHKLDKEKKQELYSKYACHELSFFVSRKDPKFFDEVVKPYLANKRDKTFLDQWLLEEDLRQYMRPWKHAQLNVVERILLGRRIDGEQPRTARHVKDLFDLIPPNVDRFNFLFNTALKGSALETEDQFGFEGAKAEEVQKLADKLQKQLGDLANNGNNKSGGDGGAGPGRSSSSGAGGKGDAEGSGSPAEPGMPSMPDAPVAAKPRPATSPKSKDSAPNREKERASKKANQETLEQTRRARGRRGDDDKYFEADRDRRKNARQFYRKLDKTKEWVENNYYKLAIKQQNAQLVTANAFWNDYAQHDPRQPFYSTKLAEASGNFTEMMFALSVLDLPAESPEHESEFEGAKMTIAAAGPIVVLHEEIKPRAR